MPKMDAMSMCTSWKICTIKPLCFASIRRALHEGFGSDIAQSCSLGQLVQDNSAHMELHWWFPCDVSLISFSYIESST